MKHYQWVVIGDIRLAYLDMGWGTPVVVLHGNGLNSRYMGKMNKLLAQQHRVLALDSRGHGRSERGQIPYSIQLYAEDFLAFCAAKKLHQITVVGYSDGANVALAAAIKASHTTPELLKQIVLIAPNYHRDGLLSHFRKATELAEKCLLAPAQKYAMAQDWLWKVQLLTGEMGIVPEDIAQVRIPMLLLGAQRDLVRRAHLESISHYAEKCTLEIIPNSTHATIIHLRRTITRISRFIG